MDSALLVLRSLNQGSSDSLDPNFAYAHEIISHFLRISNISILLPAECDVRKYQDCLNRDFGSQIRVISLTELNRHRTEPRDTRLRDLRPFVDRSVQVYEYLCQFNYDLVIFDVFDAPGFLPIRGKRTGLDLAKTRLVSWLRTCHEFLDHQVLETHDNFDPFFIKEQLDFAEKYCCENSDLVLSHTDTILKWAFDQEWKIDTERIVRLKDLKAGRVLKSPRQGMTGHDAMWDQELHGSKEIPLVSICVAHYNDGRNLGYLLKSIKHNDYNNFEVIVVDDGSTDTESLEMFKSLIATYASGSWKFIMKEQNEGPGPTRNLAVSHAKADLIIFMDSDNLATKTMISDFVNAMSKSGADCLTCSMLLFEGDTASPNQTDLIECWMPLGGCVKLGFYHNFFGDTNFCVKKSVFEALDGFSEVLGIPEDWDFLARLVLSGFEMDVVPKGIYFYRLRKGGRFRSTWSANSIETLRRRLLATADPGHEKLIHSLLLREISENERLRASVWKLDRKVVKIVLRMSQVISEEHRLIIQKLTVPVWRKIRGIINNAAQFVRGWNLMLGKSHGANHRAGPSVESRIDSSRFFARTLSDSEFQDQLTYLGLPSNRPIFGFMGGLTDENRPLGFLRLAYWTQMSSDNSFFVMVGDGPLRDEVIATETKYNLHNFKHLPSVEKPEELYALLSGLIITSASEQQGPKEVFEALASGVPVFSTDVGEAKRVLGQYGSGLAVTHDPKHKDFANCFKLWKDNLEIYKAAAMETADLIRMRFGG